jgi:hypothetical protein
MLLNVSTQAGRLPEDGGIINSALAQNLMCIRA